MSLFHSISDGVGITPRRGRFKMVSTIGVCPALKCGTSIEKCHGCLVFMSYVKYTPLCS